LGENKNSELTFQVKSDTLDQHDGATQALVFDVVPSNTSAKDVS